MITTLFDLCIMLLTFYTHTKYVDQTLEERGLLSQSVKPKTILDNYNLAFSEKSSRFKTNYTNFHAQAFVTPWEKDGYKYAEEFGYKFDTIIPTWLRVEKNEKEHAIQGFDVVNLTWVNLMHNKYPGIKITPRLNIEMNPQLFFKGFKDILKKVIADLKEIEKDYDGIYFEVLPYYFTIDSSKMLSMISSIRSIFKKKQITLSILTPKRFEYSPQIESSLKKANKYVDYFLAPAYEIPNSLSSVDADAIVNAAQHFNKLGITKKTLIGLPCFGLSYSSSGRTNYVFGEKMISILNESKPMIQWFKDYSDSLIFYNDHGSVTLAYPLPYTYEQRIKLAMSNGFTGVGLWEIGQGLPVLYDVI